MISTEAESQIGSVSKFLFENEVFDARRVKRIGEDKAAHVKLGVGDWLWALPGCMMYVALDMELGCVALHLSFVTQDSRTPHIASRTSQPVSCPRCAHSIKQLGRIRNN